MLADWLGRFLPAEVVIGVAAALSGSAYVVDILAPYFLTSQGESQNLSDTYKANLCSL